MSQPQHTLLFVDDDADLRALLSDLMTALAADAWRVLTASSSGEALDILDNDRVDLIATDVHMPVVDGLQFIRLLHRRYPNLIKVVLTGDTTAAFRASCLANGADLYLEKPREPGGWEAVHAMLNEIIRYKPSLEPRGVLRPVQLCDFLQLECLARRSCVVGVQADAGSGVLYVREGQLVHAAAGDIEGAAALGHLLALEQPRLTIRSFEEPPRVTLTQAWQQLLVCGEPVPPRLLQPVVGVPSASTSATPGFSDDTQFLVRLIEQAATGERTGEARSLPPVAYRPETLEFLLCSHRGEILHEWQSPLQGARLVLLEFLSQRTRQMAHALPLGTFDRLELEGVHEAALVKIAPDHGAFLRTAKRPDARS